LTLKRSKAGSTKYQVPNEKQILMNKFPNPKQDYFDHLKIGIFLGFVIWILGQGLFSLVH